MALESDWAFLLAALPDLRSYILSSDLYWPLRSSRGTKIPQLTIGNLMLSQARLAASVQGEQQKDFLALSQQLQQTRTEWRTNWGMKASREFGSRLNLWEQYIRELRGDLRKNQGYYPNEVRNRTILRLLRSELTEPVAQNEEDLEVMLDQILRGLTRPGPFVWEPELADAFPSDGFWFLYVTF